MFWSSSDQSLFNQGNDSHENVLLFQPSFSDYPDIRWPLVVWWLRVFFDDCDAVHFPKDAFGQRCGILHNWWCPHGSVCRFRNPNAVEKSLPSCAKPTRTWGKQECPSLLGCSMSSAGTPFDIQVCVIVRFGVKQMSRLYSDSFRVTQLPFPPSRTNTLTDNGETSLTRLILSFFKPFFFFVSATFLTTAHNFCLEPAETDSQHVSIGVGRWHWRRRSLVEHFFWSGSGKSASPVWGERISQKRNGWVTWRGWARV